VATDVWVRVTINGGKELTDSKARKVAEKWLGKRFDPAGDWNIDADHPIDSWGIGETLWSKVIVDAKHVDRNYVLVDAKHVDRNYVLVEEVHP